MLRITTFRMRVMSLNWNNGLGIHQTGIIGKKKHNLSMPIDKANSSIKAAINLCMCLISCSTG